MKSVLLFALLPILSAAGAERQEPPKMRIAVVRLDRIASSGMNYEAMRLLSLDKATLAALEKISVELQEVLTQITDVDDETKLAELSRRLEFLNRKSALLKQRTMTSSPGGRDGFALIREFVVTKFKKKYPVILQDMGTQDRIIWKADNVEFNDITDEVQEALKEHLEELGGHSKPRPSSKPAELPQKK